MTDPVPCEIDCVGRSAVGNQLTVFTVTSAGAVLTLPEAGVSLLIPEGAVPSGHQEDVYLAVVNDSREKPQLTGETRP